MMLMVIWRQRDLKQQAYAAMVFVPFILRATGLKTKREAVEQGLRTLDYSFGGHISLIGAIENQEPPVAADNQKIIGGINCH